jgi:hypothetical protein
MVFDILCGEIPEVRALENGYVTAPGGGTKGQPGGARRLASRGGSRGSHGRHEEDLVSGTFFYR